jgi:hypothetical protein
MNDKTGLQSEASATEGLSSTEGASLSDLLSFSDTELLRLAAKSIGGHYHCFTDSITFDGGIIYEQWNPFKDNGDAFELAVKLCLDIRFHWSGESDQYDCVSVDTHGATKPFSCFEEPIGWHGEQIDDMQATRTAIVRAAVQIARART